MWNRLKNSIHDYFHFYITAKKTYISSRKVFLGTLILMTPKLSNSTKFPLKEKLTVILHIVTMSEKIQLIFGLD